MRNRVVDVGWIQVNQAWRRKDFVTLYRFYLASHHFIAVVVEIWGWSPVAFNSPYTDWFLLATDLFVRGEMPLVILCKTQPQLTRL
jgi:hypothetical protein